MLSKRDAFDILFQRIKTLKKRDIILNLIVIFILASGVAAVFHDYSWYDKTIVKIERVENSLNDESNQGGKKEKHYSQAILGVIMNGEHQGEKVSLENRYSSSGVLDERYRTGNEVFVKIDPENHEKLTGSITGLKRDKYVAMLLALFIFFLLSVTKRKGFFALISLAINIAVLWYALHLNYSGHNILTISNCLVLFFTFTSLIFISGVNRKTFIAVLSTLISLFFTMLLFEIMMRNTNGVDYTYVEYIAGQNNVSELFLSQILIGGLGAIMDVAITEASAINELVDKNSGISLDELLKSGREVGHDIMGTMINVMLFTYICGTIPLIILKMKNDVKLHSIIMWQMPMEIYRFIIGSIGILLAIPISLFISIAFFKKLRRSA
ncbi:MAG TPA: YibE/F family protein [Bacillota bacterium]|nr:YibE/F family protein [Bacillota bacterium]